MALLDSKYRELKPTEKYLTDKVVLAQAWKKAHQYIRSSNWYADTFELDRSAIDLDNQLDEWIKQLGSESFAFDSLKLIPAPKSATWHFCKPEATNLDFLSAPIVLEDLVTGNTHNWEPQKDDDYEDGIKPLRPLAHVSIRDQSLVTALMMCLANRVETAQGDTSTAHEHVHEKNVVNYGNRLFSQFENGKADFSWGNSTTYSKYFSDYQRFLARPAHFGYEARQRKIDNEQVYEVHLDLEKFYDKVKRDILISKIRELAGDEDKIVERLLTQFECWQWGETCPELYAEVCANGDVDIPLGIPQGLVAGGFFANIYLLKFDSLLADFIGKELVEGIRLVDYCRYVDDMRLILVADKSLSNNIQKKIEEKLGAELSPLGLSFNEEKTRVEVFRSKKSGISTKLKDIQHKVSGPISINEIDEQLGHLEGLLGLADSLRLDLNDKENNNPLAMIESPSNDVREDTLLRFSANKIHALLRQKRSLVAQEVDEHGKAKPGSWDFLQERMARKFISAWSKDPSLVLLLKKGLELFPDKKLLAPVVSQLLLARNRNSEKQKRIAEYCLCEIFRHTSTIIHSKDSWAFPAHADIEAFFESLQTLAIKVIEPNFTDNDYLGKQALFLLLVRNDSPLGTDTSDKNFNVIIKMIKGFRNISAEMTISDFVTNALLAYQLGRDKESVFRATNSLLDKIATIIPGKKPGKKLSHVNLEKICRTLAIESMVFFSSLVSYAKGSDSDWPSSIIDLIEQLGINRSEINGDLGRYSTPVALLGVIKRQDNPFAHENALLRVLHTALVNGEQFEKDLDLANCKVSCKDWKKIQSMEPDIEIELKWLEDEGLYPIPKWVSEEHRPLYRIGTFLRCCLLGSVDWSAANSAFTDEAGYFGLKTSFYKRQLGMMHSPEALNGDQAPMSSWLTGLLFHLLQWPGVKLHDGGYSWPSQWNLKSLKELIEKRIEYQKRFFCQSSGIPAYVERVKLDWEDDKSNLNVVMVQSLLPLKTDFRDHGMMLDTTVFKARHRRHVAAVAELILHKVYSQNSIDDENFDQKPNIDLIIWPELSVSHDDVDILKRLSDKTGAMIFAGMTYTHLSGVEGPNNVAKWIVPKKQASGRQFLTRLQGKFNMTSGEIKSIKPWRPYQLLIELIHPKYPDKNGFMLTGSICYDATDIKLSADLKDKSDGYIVSALNQDVATFDSMVDALYYHMYQHVTLVNTGEFGGSVAKAPYKERYEKLITHVHGANQVSISSFEMNMFDFRGIGKSLRSGKKIKTKPAG